MRKRVLSRSLQIGPALLLSAAAAAAPIARLQHCSSIMPLGDSITLGTNGGYRNDLYTGLEKLHCAVDYVGTLSDANTRVVDKQHEGHGGLGIRDIAREVRPWLAASKPKIILVMIGTNDTAWWTNESGVEIGGRHNALIGQLHAARPNAWIFVASIPPQSAKMIHGKPNGGTVDRAILTRQFNAAIRANVYARAAAGQPVHFVDVYAGLTMADLSADGVHPSEAGYAKIAQLFLDAIRASLGAQ
jgi:lysophospholipase L1-like esterase